MNHAENLTIANQKFNAPDKTGREPGNSLPNPGCFRVGGCPKTKSPTLLTVPASGHIKAHRTPIHRASSRTGLPLFPEETDCISFSV